VTKLREYFGNIGDQRIDSSKKDVSVSVIFKMLSDTNAVIRKCLKAIFRLPLTSLSIENRNNIEQSSIEEEIAIIKETMIDVVRENKHLKNFCSHYSLGFLWLRNVDLYTPDPDDKKLFEEYLSDALESKNEKSNEIKTKILQNAKHRVEVVRHYEN
jgi:hypothetical protein